MATIKGGLLLYREQAIGSIDGDNTAFNTTFRYIPGTLRVYVNGLEQFGSDDYVEISLNSFELVNPPLGGFDADKVIVSYQRA